MEPLSYKYLHLILPESPFVLSFFSITAGIFGFILISRVVDVILIRRKRFFTKKAQQIILSYLFNENEWDYKQLTYIQRRYLNTRFRREIFLNSLRKLQNNIAGDSAERTRSLYRGLRLHRRSLKKLRSSADHVIIRGIMELSEMKAKDYAHKIRPFVNHKNDMLRTKAQIALLLLDFGTPFNFLNDLKTPLSDWQQMLLANVSKKVENSSLPEFKQWLDHQEESIVIFCIRMISLHLQLDASEKLTAMLKDPGTSQEVRSALIFAVRQLELYDAGDFLKEICFSENLRNKEEIMKTLAQLKIEPLPDTWKKINIKYAMR